MITKLKIIDKAFDLLNIKPEDRTIDGMCFRRANLFYNPVRDEMLRAKKWDFAITKQDLKFIGEGCWEYPTNALSIIQINHKINGQYLSFEEQYNIELERRIIYCPHSEVVAQIIRNDLQEKDFSEDFVDVFSLALASDLCICLLGNLDKQQELMQKLFLKLGSINETSVE